MKSELDDMLKDALAPSENPDFWLNQRILSKAKERETMAVEKRRRLGRIPAVVLSAAVVLGLGSVTAYAAWRYLAPEQVAKEYGDEKLAKAFQSSDAVRINETQTGGGYQVTLLGLVSGKDIADFLTSEEGSVGAGETYCVTAIERTDGTPMPDTSSDDYGEEAFFVSPLIKGYNPLEYNAMTMGGGYSEFVEDGVCYRIAECDNVEIFADQGLYLCVSDSIFYEASAYNYDEQTGEISRNENYEGLNALFTLPIDPKKADPEAVKQYLESFEESGEENLTEDEAVDETMDEADRFMANLNADNIEKYCEPVECTRQTVTPDEDGYIGGIEWEIEGQTSGTLGKSLVSALFPDEKPGMSDNMGYSSSGDVASLTIDTFTLNEDGTVTFVIYVPKQQ